MFSSTTSTESETTKEFATYKKSVPQLQHKINQVSRRLKALSHPDRTKNPFRSFNIKLIK